MKRSVLGINLILILGFTCFAQLNGSSSASANGSASALGAGTSIDAELQQNLDVKSAKVGDQVVFKTTRAIKQNGKTVVEKGSKLYGHVTQVEEKTKNNATSKLGLVFDRIQGDKLSYPISATIVSITNASANASAGGEDVSGTLGTDTRVMSQSSTGNSGGGGLLGGVGNTVGGVVNTTNNTVGGVTNTAVKTVGSTAQSVGQTVNGIQITPAVSVNGSASSSTTLSAVNKNVHIDKGANFQLRLGGN